MKTLLAITIVLVTAIVLFGTRLSETTNCEINLNNNTTIKQTRSDLNELGKINLPTNFKRSCK